MTPRLAFRATCAATIVVVLALAAASHAQDAASAAAFHSQVTALRDRVQAPALSAAIVVGGRLVAVEAVGFADVDRKVSAAPSSRFRVGSLSKLLTATAALRLVQQRRLTLDEPIGSSLRNVPPDKASITPRQLAAHLAGFAHYGRDNYISTAHYTDVTDVLPQLLAQPLLAPPGTRYSYSSYGFNVLGAVIQSAGKKPFAQVVAEEVIEPLGLRRTSLDDSADQRVRLYSRDKDILREVPPSDLSDRWPSGGYLSTAEDMARFGDASGRPPYLTEQSRSLILTPQSDSAGKETNVGIGWRIGRDGAGRRYLHHGGEALGGRAFLLVFPDHQVAVAILANLSFASFDERDAIALVMPFVR